MFFKYLFNNSNKIFYLIILSFIFHIVASYYSVGFFKYDEHFSILEPINFKLNRDATLGWDFFQHYDRSWFLPYIYLTITKIFLIFKIDNPFYWAFAYRLFSAILGFISILCIISFALKIFNSPGATVEAALQWCVANADLYSIDAINLSLGFSGDFFQNDQSY